MDQLRSAGRVAAIDLRRRVRNRSFLIQTIVGPIVLAAIISLAFGSSWSITATIGVVDDDGSELGAAFIDVLTERSEEGLTFEELASADGLELGSGDGAVDAAIVIADGFGESLAGDTPIPLTVLTSSDAPIAGEVADAVARGFASRVDAARLAAASTIGLGAALPNPDDLGAIEVPIELTSSDPGDAAFPGAFFGPAMGLLFLFLAVATVSRDLLAEQRRGVLDRLRAAPVRDASILAGKAAGVVVLGIVTLGVVWGVTSLTLGADWGDPLGVAIVIVSVSLTVAALSGLVAAVARTEQSADTLASFLAFAFGLIGGNFTGPGSLPEGLRRLSLLTPNGWAMAAFTELSAGAASVADVALHAGVLTAMALAIGGVAAVLLPRRIGAGR